MAIVRIRSMEHSTDPIGKRTHDFPACSAVLQPTAPPPTPQSVQRRRVNYTSVGHDKKSWPKT